MSPTVDLTRSEKCVLRQSRHPLYRRILCGAVRAAFPLVSAALILQHLATTDAIWGAAGYTLLFGRLLWMVGQACRARRALRGIAAKYEQRLAELTAGMAAGKSAA